MDLPHHLCIHCLFIRERPTAKSAAEYLKKEPIRTAF